MRAKATWMQPDALFDGTSIQPDMALCVEAGKVTRVAKAAPDLNAQKVAGIACPGFVDLQVNGGGNHLFNATPTPETILKIAAAHHALGTTRLLPTVITDEKSVLEQAVEASLVCKDARGILGIHIEGPHISAERRGTHAKRFIRPFDDHSLGLVRKLRDAGVRVVMTLAPEAATPAQVSQLSEMGAVVSIGHTDATADEARAMFKAGATCVTHLFNAMSPMLNRAPGVVGAAINSDAYCGIICDGMHVADEMVGLACRARPTPRRTFLVSDAMPTVGGNDHFDLYDTRIRLDNGKLINAEGSLAGAHVTMFQSVVRLVGKVGIPLADALAMATSIPLCALMQSEALENPLIGEDLADLLLIEKDLSSFSFAQDRLRATAA